MTEYSVHVGLAFHKDPCLASELLSAWNRQTAHQNFPHASWKNLLFMCQNGLLWVD